MIYNEKKTYNNDNGYGEHTSDDDMMIYQRLERIIGQYYDARYSK